MVEIGTRRSQNKLTKGAPWLTSKKHDMELGVLANYVFMSWISVRLSIFVAPKQLTTFCLLSFNGAFVWWLLLHGDTFRGYVYLWWCVRNLGCTWLLFCLLVDFMWSGWDVCDAFGFGRCGLLHPNYVFKGLWKMKIGF